MNFAKLAVKLGVPYFSLLSFQYSNSKLLSYQKKDTKEAYHKTKLNLENDIKLLGLNQLAIFKPGHILLNDSDSILETTAKLAYPLTEKINASLLGETIFLHAVECLKVQDEIKNEGKG